MLIRSEVGGLQTQEVRLWEEGQRANDAMWVVVVLVVVAREPERRGRNRSDSILFCELEAASVSCKLARRTPPARPVPCLPAGLDPGSELARFEALQPRPAETSSHFHYGLDTIGLEQSCEVVFFSEEYLWL